jgi:transposase
VRFPAAVIGTGAVRTAYSKAAVVQLTHHHMLPLARTGELMGDLFGLPMCDATVLAIQAEAQELLAPTVAAMGEALKCAAVAHADETGMRVGGKLHWMHVLVTPLLTWLGAHPNRGQQGVRRLRAADRVQGNADPRRLAALSRSSPASTACAMPTTCAN